VVEEVRVLRADAHVDDELSLRRLLESLPEADEIRAQLSRRFFARAWDKDSNRDYWVRSDGKQAACFTVCGLTLKQAAAVRVRWDALTSTVDLSERILGELVSAETGETVQVISLVKSPQSVPLQFSEVIR
jgi:hypothetical protein